MQLLYSICLETKAIFWQKTEENIVYVNTSHCILNLHFLFILHFLIFVLAGCLQTITFLVKLKVKIAPFLFFFFPFYSLWKTFIQYFNL